MKESGFYNKVHHLSYKIHHFKHKIHHFVAYNTFQPFQWKNPDFLFRNPDLLFRNPKIRLKNVDFIIKTDQRGAATNGPAIGGWGRLRICGSISTVGMGESACR